MCDKAILENGRTLKSVPDSCKNKKISNKAGDNCFHALEFVSDCYKSQEKCKKLSILLSPSAIQFVSKCYKTQEDLSLYV